LPYFDLSRAEDVEEGTRVLAFSNMFNVASGNEPASVQHGVVSSKTRMDARRGTYRAPYRGPVYVLDMVTSNPGTAGGALVTRDGRLVGMLGKELTNARNNTWLNHAIPIGELRASVEEIRTGKFIAARRDDERKKPDRPLDVSLWGVVLAPDVVERTPPYVDQVRPGSPAEREGVRPDDLVVLLDDRPIQSCKSLAEELEYVDREDSVRLTLLRDGELLEVSLKAALE
jgi:serine protease Do